MGRTIAGGAPINFIEVIQTDRLAVGGIFVKLKLGCRINHLHSVRYRVV